MISFLRNLIVRDFWLKLFSLVLAVLIWLTVWYGIRNEVSPMKALTSASNDTEQHTYYGVPVHVNALAGEVRSYRVTPTDVEIRVQAEPRLLQNLPGQLRAEVDLTGIESAARLRKRIQVEAPPGVVVVHVIPGEVQVDVPPNR